MAPMHYGTKRMLVYYRTEGRMWVHYRTDGTNTVTLWDKKDVGIL